MSFRQIGCFRERWITRGCCSQWSHVAIVFAATLLFAAVIFLIEIVAPRVKRPFTLAGLGVAAFSMCLGTFVFDALGKVYQPEPLVNLPAFGILSIVGIVVLYDFIGYWLHRAQHRWFWRFHAVHHAPREMHGHIAAIGHPVEFACRYFLVAIPLGFIDISAIAIPAAVEAARRFYEFYIHSEVDAHFGPGRLVFVDNRFHRLHHGRGKEYKDCNFAIVFTLWDRLFGTAKFPAKDEWPEVGLDDYQPATSIGRFLAHPWSSRPHELPTPTAVRFQPSVKSHP